jgi:hypothetical protein
MVTSRLPSSLLYEKEWRRRLIAKAASCVVAAFESAPPWWSVRSGAILATCGARVDSTIWRGMLAQPVTYSR